MAVDASLTQQLPWHAAGSGVTQFTRAEAQSFARNILSSNAYRDKLKSRAEAGTLPPAVEMMLWHYAYGKPPEQVDVNIKEDLTSLSLQQLAQRASAAQDALRRAMELEQIYDTVASEVQ